MNLKQKKFSIYVFLSTLARSLIEVYIPIILYKYGYSLKEVILYYLIVNLVSLLLTYPVIFISKKYDNKLLIIFGIIAFLGTQIYLNFISYSIWYIIIIASLYAIYRRCYWISRRFYNLMIIKKDNISSTYSKISIINEIGVLVATYLGALLLDYVNTQILTLIAMTLFMISTIPIFKLELNISEEKEKLSLINTLKKIPISNIYHFGAYELLNVVKFLIPLYLFIYIKNTYQVIGIYAVISDFSLMVFTYLFGKKLDNTKRSFLSLSIILFIIITVLRVNVIGVFLVVVTLIDGVVKKMYELAISNQFYTYSKKFEYYNYNLVYEVTQNSSRLMVVTVLYLFISDIKMMVYVTLLFILFALFFKFKQKEDDLHE